MKKMLNIPISVWLSALAAVIAIISAFVQQSEKTKATSIALQKETELKEAYRKIAENGEKNLKLAEENKMLLQTSTELSKENQDILREHNLTLKKMDEGFANEAAKTEAIRIQEKINKYRELKISGEQLQGYYPGHIRLLLLVEGNNAIKSMVKIINSQLSNPVLMDNSELHNKWRDLSAEFEMSNSIDSFPHDKMKAVTEVLGNHCKDIGLATIRYAELQIRKLTN